MSDYCGRYPPADHFRLYMEARCRAAQALCRYAAESEAAHYHLFMCARERGRMPAPPAEPSRPARIPYPEDLELPPRRPV